MISTTAKRDHIAKWLVSGIICVYCVIGLVIILRNPVKIAGDEGIIFCQSLAFGWDPSNVAKVWNDQPWFYCAVCGYLYRFLGFTPELPRMFALGCVALYCWNIKRLMPPGTKSWHQLFAVALFFTFPEIIYQSVSSTCELPNTLLALLGASVLFNPRPKCNWVMLLGGGVLTAIAMQIKITAGMVFGAASLAFAIWQGSDFFRQKNTSILKRAFASYAIWAGSLWVVFFLLFLCFPPSTFESLWLSHKAAGHNIPLSEINTYIFRWSNVFQSAATWIGFVMGTVWLVRRRAPGPWLLPVSYSICALIIHCVNRPFYQYYVMEFAAGFAPVAGWAVAELADSFYLRGSRDKKTRRVQQFNSKAMIGGIALICVWLGTDGVRVGMQLMSLLKMEKADGNRIVQALRSHKEKIKWAFSYAPENALIAQAGLLIPPELLPLSNNRYWSRSLDESRVMVLIKEYHPEALILGSDFVKNRLDWRTILSSSYEKVVESDGKTLYFNKSVSGHPS